MKSLWELMLKGTEYEDILHGDYPSCEGELIHCLDGFDFVVEEWLESMREFGVSNVNIDKIASSVMMSVISCRFAIVDYFNQERECPDLVEETSYLEVLRTLKELKQSFMALAKSYAQTRYLSNWYLDLPLKIQAGFKYIHNKKVKAQKERLNEWNPGAVLK